MLNLNNKIEDTEGLWRRVKIGDEKAFDSLFEQCYTHLCNFANRMLGNMAEAEETVQDAFITIWQNRHNISVTGSFKSYLYQSVHNLAINKIHHFRTLKYQPNRSADPTLWQRIHDTFTIDDSLIQLLEANETEALIKKAVDRLPDKCKEIFILNRFENLTYEEIATKLNISQNTVRVQIFRALDILRGFIEKNIS